MESNRLNEPPSFPSYNSSGSGGTGTAAGGAPLASMAEAAPESGLDSVFVCSVCLDPVKNPVITQCGHLYCWSCLYRWLNTQHSTCPVCKAGVSKENVIPIFIRGCEQDPRGEGGSGGAAGSGDGVDGAASEPVPNRPQGRRPEPTQQHNNNLFPGEAAGMNAQFGGVAYTGSFGFFPSLFGLQFQSFVPPLPTNRPLTPDEEHEKFLSKVLVTIGGLVVLCLVFF